MFPSTKQNIMTLPFELLEMILLFCAKDWFFVISMVCRKWNIVISRWRYFNDSNQKMITPSHVIVDSQKLCEWFLSINYPYSDKICQISARYGKLTILQWAWNSGYSFNDKTCSEAAKNGHLDVLDWLLKSKCYFNRDICCQAAKNGHLHILEYISNLYQNNYKWDNDASESAAAGGHIKILEWLSKKGCIFDDETMESAIGNGNIKVIHWLREKGCSWDIGCFILAAKLGRIDILNYIHQSGTSLNEIDIIFRASLEGHSKTVFWLRSIGCDWDESVCEAAATGNHLELLKSLRSNGCPWSEETLDMAVSENNFELAKWAFENGCPLSDSIITFAISSNNLELIKWLISIGSQWDEETSEMAASLGYIDILHYLIQNECPYENLDFTAIENNQLDCLKWIHENVEPCDSNCYYYVENPNILNWLKSQNISFSNDIVFNSIKNNNLTLFEWFCNNGFILKPTIITIAAKYKSFDIIEYALKCGCSIEQQLFNDVYFNEALKTNNILIIELLVKYNYL
jgi:hypothetical protein